MVAVEANQELCLQISNKFAEEIKQGKLVVERYVLCDSEDQDEVAFYIHKTNHVLSQFPRPKDELIHNFDQVLIPSITPAKLIRKHGDPHYIKIDIEHFDAQILRSLFQNHIRPPYISAEAHTAEVFSLLVTQGGYDAFKLVDGASVAIDYKNRTISSNTGSRVNYSFPFHSAGPYGDDVDGDWLTANAMLRKLGLYGCGWRDLHATNEAKKTVDTFPYRREFPKYVLKKLSARLRRLLSSR